ncbi:TPR-like protein [Serendipita vermifera]|nr:TPR-like protein [Serendipita vermifera]
MALPSHLSAPELALATGQMPKNQDELPPLIRQVIECNFEAVLKSDIAKDLLASTDDIQEDVQDQSVEHKVESLRIFGSDMSDFSEEISRLAIGVAAFHAFLQANWTGPNLTFTPSEVLQPSEVGDKISTSKLSDDQLNTYAVQKLARDGEPAYHLAQHAILLYIALKIFQLPYQRIGTMTWWRLRVARIHREILDEPVLFSEDEFTEVENFAASLPTENPDLLGRLRIEKALMHHLLRQDKRAADEFIKAAKAMDLQYELTGVKGKRTKFQVQEITQLVLLAKGRTRAGEDDEAEPKDKPSELATESTEGKEQLPETLPLNDETLLEKTEYTTTSLNSTSPLLSQLDPNNQPSLHPLDQSVLLGLCLHVKNTSPEHGLTSEQMSPYVARVISHPRNWSVHTMSLLLRSRLEANRTRTVERSALQLQALIDQMPTSDSTVSQRLAYFHQIALPSKWSLERELAMRLVGLGVLKSALEILERLEMWEEVVHCWQALERPDQGIKVVKELLEGRKKEADMVLYQAKEAKKGARAEMDRAREAKLWCLLGELEPANAESHYQKAWEVSNKTSGRAMRSLGGYYFARAKYSEAIECLTHAVSIQPLLSRSWFILGCALIREEKWEEARRAFSRCVVLDEEDSESWNNLASVYLRLGTEAKEGEEANKPTDNERPKSQVAFENKVLAFRALQQGLKSNYSNWRMWSNYMVVSVDVGELSEACRALGRVIEERAEKDGEAAVDTEVLVRLVNAVTRAADEPEAAEGESQAANPNEGLGLYPRVEDLFTRIILPRISSSPRIWTARAQLLTWRKKWSDALDAYTAAYRCGVAMNPKVEVELESWRAAVEEVEEYVDVLRNFGPKAAAEEAEEGKKKKGGSWAFQARGIVRTFMGRTRQAFEDEPEWERLATLLNELKEANRE